MRLEMPEMEILDVPTVTMHSAQRLKVVEKLLQGKTHKQPWSEAAPYDLTRSRLWRSQHKRAYFWMVREFEKRMRRPLATAPVWLSFDYDTTSQVQYAYGREAIERIITLDVPTDEVLFAMHEPWMTHVLAGYCIEDEIPRLPVRFDRSGMRFCAACEHTGRARRASWESIFSLSGDPTKWQGIVDRIEPQWLRAIEGEPVLGDQSRVF
jgi:hypothetical protein